jgi:hypothetical protein
MVRYWFYIITIVFLAAIGFISTIWIHVLWSLAIIVPLVIIGLNDIVQKKHAILRNFPVIGHLVLVLSPTINILRYWDSPTINLEYPIFSI